MSVESEAGRDHLTELLVRWSKGDKDALQSLIPVVYKELRQLAHNHLQREQRRQTVQTATVVHEAYLRLAKYSPRALRDRKQFFAMASGIMRQVLVDHARERHARKRDAGIKVELTPEMAATSSRELDLLTLDEALGRLEKLDPRQSRIVQLRFFAGLSIEETSEVLGMSPSTVTRDWLTARAWLQRHMLHKREASNARVGDV
jgi:RNA polymerase sigma factor (TIGR02999 family)